MKKLNIKIFALIISLLITLLVAIPGKTLAANPSPKVPSPIQKQVLPKLVFSSRNVIVYAFGGKVKDKKEAAKIFESQTPLYHSIQTKGNGNEFSTMGSYQYTLNGYKQISYGNAYAYAKFNSTLDLNLPRGFATRVTVTNSENWASWLGTEPQYNATYIDPEATWTWYGATSVSAGTSGGGFSITGNTVSWHGPLVYNTWYTSMTTGGMSGSGALTDFAETFRAGFFFNSTNKTIMPFAQNSMWV